MLHGVGKIESAWVAPPASPFVAQNLEGLGADTVIQSASGRFVLLATAGPALLFDSPD